MKPRTLNVDRMRRYARRGRPRARGGYIAGGPVVVRMSADDLKGLVTAASLRRMAGML